MFFRKKYVAIVSAYSAGNLLARQFRKYGYRCIHVQPREEIAEENQRYYWRPQDFVENIVHHGDLEATLLKVSKFKPHFVVAGAESGVHLADALSERLGLPTNGSALSDARRDKYLMAEALRKAGVPHIPHFKSSDLQSLLSWIDGTIGYPAVAKPLTGSGSDHVILCQGPDDVRRAYSSMMGQVNSMWTVNQEVLVQRFTPGDEYVINVASSDGRHLVTDIWLSCKTKGNGRDFLYDYQELLAPEGERQQALASYLFKALDALGIRFGSSHCELKWSPEGPVLIEMGARMGGGVGHQMNLECSGTNQAIGTVQGYCDPEALAELAKPGRKNSKHALLVCLISNRQGIVRAVPGADRVKRLPSFYRVYTYEPGDEISITYDLQTCPGDVSLIHPERSIVLADMKKVREIEADGFFEVTVPGLTSGA